jgi:YHS domain-containing protein
MRKSQIKNASLFVVLFSFLITAGVFAQDKKDGSCCSSSDKKTENMDHSKMDHSKMTGSAMNTMKAGEDTTQAAQLSAKEVDSKLEAWNAVCPVKGNKVDPEAHKVEYNGKIYGFCCNGCDTKFIKDPDKYSKNLSDDGKTFIGTK